MMSANILKDKIWTYQDQDGIHKLSEMQIINSYYDQWRAMINDKFEYSYNDCIRDFEATFWAWSD
jgi:hypothetical protein